VQFLKNGIAKLNVPYSYGFAIILLTVFVKLATYPLTKKQVRSSLRHCVCFISIFGASLVSRQFISTAYRNKEPVWFGDAS